MEDYENREIESLCQEAAVLIREVERLIEQGGNDKLTKTRKKIDDLKDEVEFLEIYYWDIKRKYPYEEILRLVEGLLQEKPTMRFVQALIELKVFSRDNINGYIAPCNEPDKMVLKRMKKAKDKILFSK